MRVALNCFLLIIALPAFCSPSGEYAHHPTPTEPKYISAEWYGTLKHTIPAPPMAGSPEQRTDEVTIAHWLTKRTPQDCERARREVSVSLTNFFGAETKGFDLRKTEPFFSQVKNDADYFIQKLKKEFPRKRPFLYLKNVEPCVPKEVTGSYPSGHAALSRTFALILAEIYPSRKADFMSRAEQISNDRVLSGVHHPSDVDAGKRIGQLVFEKLKTNPQFNDDLKAVKVTTATEASRP